ncbi:hypothetical protein BsWGS_19241 [Bradybaena similaris]
MCYVCCRTYADSEEGIEPEGMLESSFDDVAPIPDFPGKNNTQTNLEFYKDPNNGPGPPGDAFKASASGSLGNVNGSSVDGSGNNPNDTSIKGEDPIGIPYTERSAGRRLGSSRYKSGRQQVSIGDLTISDLVPRHGALLHKNDKIDTLAVKVEPAMASDTADNLVKRKRRIPSSSATPSIQIVILVVGAVVGCLLLTGFVRWRVRGRLNAKKKSNMSDDFINEHGRVYKGSTEMSTIYECEFEERQSMLRGGEAMDVDMEDYQVDDGTKFGEISYSKRFDKPLSAMSGVYHSRHSLRQPQPRSPKSARHFRLVPGSKRNSMNRHKYGHRNRYSKHLKRRLENMFVQTLETIPMETISHVNENGDSLSCSSLFSELGNKYGIRNVSSEHLASTSQQQAAPMKHGSPTFRRGAFASILNTWRSLSFNRDWVGKMWQEQHNIRRLSDILRGRRESLSSRGSKDSDAQSSRLSSSTESVSSASSFGSYFARIKNGNADKDVVALFRKHTAPPPEKPNIQNGHAFVTADASATVASNGTEQESSNNGSTSRHADTPIPATDGREKPTHGPFMSFLSCSDLHQEPVEYDSLLSSSLHSCDIPARLIDEHPRYQRIHMRTRSEGRKRSNSFNSYSHSPVRYNHFGNDSNQGDFSQLSRDTSGTRIRGEVDMSDTCVPIASATQLHAGEQNVGLTSVGSESSSALVSPTVSPSVPQKRSVADQHSPVITSIRPRQADHSNSKQPCLE